MKDLLKTAGVLLFAAGDVIEKKAEEFRKQRKERYKKMAYAVKKEMTGNLGFASAKDVEDLKKQVETLISKIDAMAK